MMPPVLERTLHCVKPEPSGRCSMQSPSSSNMSCSELVTPMCGCMLLGILVEERGLSKEPEMSWPDGT